MDAFDPERLDEVIHGRVRLAIMAYLANAEVATFNELRDALDATQGNLSVHLRKLEDAGYVGVDKSIVNRKTLTKVRITRAGRRALGRYLDAMAELVETRAKKS